MFGFVVTKKYLAEWAAPGLACPHTTCSEVSDTQWRAVRTMFGARSEPEQMAPTE